MNSVHLLTQEKYRVENRFKNQVGCTECTVLASPSAQAARLPPLLRTPRVPLPAARAPCRAPSRSNAPRACARAAQRPCRLRATPARPTHARLPHAPCTPSTHAPRALPARPEPSRPAPSASTPSSTIQHFFLYCSMISNLLHQKIFFFIIHDKYFFFPYFQQYEKSLKITKIIFFFILLNIQIIL